MSGLLQDVRFALRQLRKSPGFPITAGLMLALAICANSTVFSWIDGTMLHPIPGAQDTGNLVSVMRGQWNPSPSPPLSYLDYRDLRDGNQTFSGILAYHHDWLTLTGGANPQRIYVANVSANFFDVLGVKPALGRFFLPSEEKIETGLPYIVLSHSLWQTRFASDPNIVGKSIEIVRKQVTVIGVAPEGFIGAMPGIRQDVWLPLNPGGDDWQMTHRSHFYLNVLGRLRPGVSRQRANEDLERLMHQIATAYPNDHLVVNTITLDPLWRSPFGANNYMATTLPILLAIAGVVLLLTCANVVTLALVRFVARRREIAIRQSLGAGRIQLVRQMVLEGFFVSLGGGALALLMTSWTAKSFARFVPLSANPIVLNGVMDRDVVILIAGLAVLAGFICGAFPALRSSRVPAAEALKEEAASVSGGSHNRRLLSGLVVTQIALSLALLITSALFLRTLRNISNANPGFDREHVLTASVGLNIAGYPRDEATAIQHRILENVSALPSVSIASLTDWVPFNFTRKTVDAYPEGYAPRPHESLEVRRADVTAGYFQTMGMQVISGRDFTRDDDEKAPRVLVVDQTAASHYWPRQNPLGKRLQVWGQMFTVVGVVKDIKHQFMNERPEPMVFMSYFQEPDSELVVQTRTRANPEEIATAVEQAIHQVDSRLPVFDVHTLREATQMSSIFAVMQSTFAGMFAMIALILAATGIYGVVAYRTQLRTHEIGIRVALGASRTDVLRLVLMQGIRLTVAGLLLGLALAIGLTRLIAGSLYGVSATDPMTMFAVVALLGVMALLACYLPALRAMRIDPVTAIREQ
ncbi:MAG: ABC transporter permease [Terracidiphilus sp.]